MYVCVLFLREGGIGVVGWCYFFRGGWGWRLVGSSYLLAQGKCVPWRTIISDLNPVVKILSSEYAAKEIEALKMTVTFKIADEYF